MATTAIVDPMMKLSIEKNCNTLDRLLFRNQAPTSVIAGRPTAAHIFHGASWWGGCADARIEHSSGERSVFFRSVPEKNAAQSAKKMHAGNKAAVVRNRCPKH